VGWLGSGLHLVGQMGSAVRVGAILQIFVLRMLLQTAGVTFGEIFSRSNLRGRGIMPLGNLSYRATRTYSHSATIHPCDQQPPTNQ